MERETRAHFGMQIGLELKGCSVTLIALYHPQYTHTSPITNTVFKEEFTVFAAKSIVKYNNISKLGDINLHINDHDNPSACMFLDIIIAMCLKQFVNFPTHRGGNTFDTIIIGNHSKQKSEHDTGSLQI